MSIRNVRAIKESADFIDYLNSIGAAIPFDEEVKSGPDAPLARSYVLNGKVVGNRFAILPMEGWDGTNDGKPSDLTKRRWQRFALSGAKLIFGGEAVAVCFDGKSSPNQLMLSKQNLDDIAGLRDLVVQTHKEHFSTADDLLVGVQLTHSGRLARPHDMSRPEPRIIYHHPLLDKLFGVADEKALMTDGEIDHLIEDFIKAARLSQQAGFDFVDIKHCHGYLGHEFLSAVDRPGKYGGSFENRTRFLREIVAGIRSEAPEIDIAVRLSAVDFLPSQIGENEQRAVFREGRYPYAFGGDGTGRGIDLTEPLAFLDLLIKLGIKLVCISAGAAYNSHIMEPYFSLPVAPRHPPEDPLTGVARLISVVADLKKQRPGLTYVGSGYSYLQQWLPNVAQSVISQDMADFVGIGRMALSYPDIITDILAGRVLKRELICHSCSYCDVAPEYGIMSGCYMLDKFYRNRPEYQQLRKFLKEK